MSLHKLPLAADRAPAHSRMWHPDIPELQLSWDATSLKNIMFCPRKYQYEEVYGYKTEKESVHLIFGRYYHSCLEAYDRALCDGADWDQARDIAAMKALELGFGWDSEDKAKHRFSLWRTVQWYCEAYTPKADKVKRVLDNNGKPMLEQAFSFVLPWTAPGGHNYFSCGYFDGIVEAMGGTYVLERKTTGKTLNTEWFNNFACDAQIDNYSTAGYHVLDKHVYGVLIDGAQVAINFSRFARAPSMRTEPQLEEFLEDLRIWIGLAEQYAVERYWPKASRFCFMCPFKTVCSKDPASRVGALLGGFRVEDWDPTIERTEG